MADTIWKYALPKIDNTVSIPLGGEVLHAALQDGTPHIWVRVDPLAVKEDRTFSIYGTGYMLGKNTGAYISTLFADHGLVYHVFEEHP